MTTIKKARVYVTLLRHFRQGEFRLEGKKREVRFSFALSELEDVLDRTFLTIADPMYDPDKFRRAGWRLIRELYLRAQDMPKFGGSEYDRMIRRLTIADAWAVRRAWRYFRPGSWHKMRGGTYRRNNDD